MQPMKRLLIQTQLSNYDSYGRWILECDSGWQMTMGRVREMLKLVPDLHIDVMGPLINQCVTHPININPDLWEDPSVANRLRYIEHYILPNALQTRYDFDLVYISEALGLSTTKYDAVLLNDPMHLRNFKAMFFMAKQKPKFFVHSHFVDDPSCPKFPVEASLWLGQCEAAIKADFNFWQCQSTLDIVEREMSVDFNPAVVARVTEKSAPWDDGYSIAEMSTPINGNNLRFDPKEVLMQIKGKVVVFVPNRIGGRGRSSDYTNCGKFMFEILPEIRKRRQDFVVIAGNPSQKFLNNELEAECGPNGYINLVPDALNRDEFKWVAAHSHIAVGLYDQDSYGGTVARECIEMGCVPLWIDNYEYSVIARLANWPYVGRKDFVDLPMMADALIETCKSGKHIDWLPKLQQVVRDRCSYEATTPAALQLMGLI
jgi:hypothetical protein